MPRGPRKKSSSGVYHVMLRGINKQTIFETDDDRYQFLKTLKKYVDLKKFIVYGYCLMDNHIHLLIQELEDDISLSIKRISSSYVLWYNNKYERSGHLFQERFKSEPVEKDSYFMVVLRYIHQNPLEAKITKYLLDYKWSSYKEYIKEPILVDTELCLNLFSISKDKAIDLFIEYMNERNTEKCSLFDDYIKLTDSQVIDEIYKRGINNLSNLQKLEKEKRDILLKEIKSIEGVSIRQLSRITGISKTLISNL